MLEEIYINTKALSWLETSSSIMDTLVTAHCQHSTPHCMQNSHVTSKHWNGAVN